ncbi:MAG: class I SAM-dependent methyltransferase [Phycisphaerales bacterium]|nr:class I SAM-dependent methyltransferase [Phycisphaerales bacterium]
MNATLRRALLALAGSCALCPGAHAKAPPSVPSAEKAAVREPAGGVEALTLEAERLRDLARSEIARAMLDEVPRLPRIEPRPMFVDRQARRYYAPRSVEGMTEEQKKRLEPFDADENLYYTTKYGSPLAYLRAFDLLGAQMPTLRGARLLDYGYGTIGHLRLAAQCGGEAVGVDVDPFLTELYCRPEDQGALPGGGRLRLVNGSWPGDAAAREQVGAGFDVFLSKNTLKKGYVNPDVEIDDRIRRMMLELGVDRLDYLRAVHDVLKPGGIFLIYNICGPQAPEDQPYLPMADGRCPWTVDELNAAGFDVIFHDIDDHLSIRAQSRALGWDQPPYSMDLDHDTFAWYTLARRRP